MATYLGTHGGKIQTYSTDPTYPNTGEVWYNSTSNTIKMEAVTTAGSWATGGALNQFRDQAAGSGTVTSTLVFGGGPPNQDKTESYNGSNWTEMNDLNTARRGIAGAGADNTSAVAFGGGSPGVAVTESWNGSNWTEVNDLNTARYFLAGTGIITAALAYGGDGNSSATESWNGTNWTETTDLSTARAYIAGSGTKTAALASGGSDKTNTEVWTGAGSPQVRTISTD